MVVLAEYFSHSGLASGALEICVACEALYRWGATLLSAEMWQPLSNLKLKLSDFIFYNLRKVEME